MREKVTAQRTNRKEDNVGTSELKYVSGVHRPSKESRRSALSSFHHEILS
jgi:hypothetical protein